MLGGFQENVQSTGEEQRGTGLVKGDHFVFAVVLSLPFTHFLKMNSTLLTEHGSERWKCRHVTPIIASNFEDFSLSPVGKKNAN